MEVVEGFALLKGTRLKKKLRQVQIKYRGICSGLVEEQTQKYLLSTPWQPVNVSKNTHCQHTMEVIRSHVSPSSLSKVPSQWYPSITEYFLRNNIHYKNIAFCYEVPAYAVVKLMHHMIMICIFLFQLPEFVLVCYIPTKILHKFKYKLINILTFLCNVVILSIL